MAIIDRGLSLENEKMKSQDIDFQNVKRVNFKMAKIPEDQFARFAILTYNRRQIGSSDNPHFDIVRMFESMCRVNRLCTS